jgi:cell division transport system ATP-binding protein
LLVANQPAQLQFDDALAHRVDDVMIVGGHQHRRSGAIDALEQVHDVLAGLRVQVAGRLVGEQQRVAIARAFVNRPLVLLADEPTGNLDPETSKDIMDLLERINRTGTTVLMATHDHHIVDSMRQRVVELSLGRLVRDEARGVYGMDR